VLSADVVPSPTLVEVLLARRIVVCVGSGGVGKTTTAAALALAAARRGKRTLVLTIDPAKRLANSLGLAELGHAVQEVDRALVRRGAPSDRGELHAMMLDQKHAFDEVVARHAKDPAAVKRILANPVYAQISGSLAGAQEYAAMAKLHDFDRTGEWDLIVVDTPPTAHALDFLDAPRKLSEAIDSPAIEWFRKLRGGSGSGWSMVGKTGGFILKRLATFVGTRFLDDLALFFTEFNDILGGFRQRAEETFALLRQDKVGFILVASPEPMAVREALYFHERLIAAGMPFVGFVVNKVLPLCPLPPQLATDVTAALARQPGVAALAVSSTTMRLAADALIASHRELEVRAEADQAELASLVRAGGPDALLVQVPLQRDDVHDVDRLVNLERYFVGR
jgi:anion-transporting  ArsA/GET3 family ATPase